MEKTRIVWTSEERTGLKFLHLEIPGSSDLLVLLDPDDGPKRSPFSNLARRKSSIPVWWAELPEAGQTDRFDCYVSTGWNENGTLWATSWSGWHVDLDPATGKIIDRCFVK